MKRAALAFLLLAVSAQAPAQAPIGPPSAPAPVADRARLEVVEDLSESLANDLLELSVAVRDRDLLRIAPFFPESLRASPFPAQPGPLQADVKWIASRSWSASAGVSGPEAAGPKADVLRELGAFLESFALIEDARFKVRAAQFDATAALVESASVPTAAPGATGEARVSFYVIGRNHDGQREWARGTAQTKVHKPASGPWQFTAFSVADLKSMVATSDLATEASITQLAPLR